MDYRISLVGLLIGFLIGLTGMGGGSLLAPIMILIFRIPPVWAVATDITYSSVTKGLGALVHVRQHQVRFRIAFWLACGSIPATLLSIFLVQYVHHHYGNVINGIIVHAIGGVLLFVAILLAIKPRLMRAIDRYNQKQEKQAALATGAVTNEENDGRTRHRALATVLVGAIVGFLVGLTSVGSGTLIIVTLAFLFPRLSPKELVGTDILQAFVMLLAGSIAYLGSGSINWNIAGLLLIGSLPGVFLGSKLSKYIPDRYMNPALALVLAVSGWKLL